MIKENFSNFKIHEGNTTMFRVYSYVAFRRSVVKISKVRQQQNKLNNDREIEKGRERVITSRSMLSRKWKFFTERETGLTGRCNVLIARELKIWKGKVAVVVAVAVVVVVAARYCWVMEKGLQQQQQHYGLPCTPQRKRARDVIFLNWNSMTFLD